MGSKRRREPVPPGESMKSHHRFEGADSALFLRPIPPFLQVICCQKRKIRGLSVRLFIRRVTRDLSPSVVRPLVRDAPPFLHRKEHAPKSLLSREVWRGAIPFEVSCLPSISAYSIDLSNQKSARQPEEGMSWPREPRRNPIVRAGGRPTRDRVRSRVRLPRRLKRPAKGDPRSVLLSTADLSASPIFTKERAHDRNDARTCCFHPQASLTFSTVKISEARQSKWTPVTKV